MTLVKWNPNRSIFNWTENFFDDFFNADRFMSRRRESWYPAVDIEENDDRYHVSMELPGMTKDDLQINYTDGVLKISGEKKEEREEKERNYHCYERRFGKFERSFRIYSDVKADKIDASFKDGILTVDLPKAETAKPKQIEVKVK